VLTQCNSVVNKLIIRLLILSSPSLRNQRVEKPMGE
jgi:hypothetical protein